jgi:hypothetical protein
MATRSTIPFEDSVTKQIVVTLKLLGGCNFNDNLNMKALKVEQGIETQGNALKSSKEQKHTVMHLG